MGRLVDLDDLASSGIVIARLGLPRVQALHAWMKSEPPCPRPVAYFSRTAVWLWPEVREWALDMGWQRWSARPTARRVLIEPSDRVPVEIIAERLGEEVAAHAAADASGLYVWRDVETLWHRRINTA